MIWIIIIVVVVIILFKFFSFFNRVTSEPFVPKFETFTNELNKDMLSGRGNLVMIDDIEYLLYNPFGSFLNTEITFKYLVSSLRVTIKTEDFSLMNDDGTFDSFSYTFKDLNKIVVDDETQKRMVSILKDEFKSYLERRSSY